MAQDVQQTGECSAAVSWACPGQVAELWLTMGCTTAGLTVPKKCAHAYRLQLQSLSFSATMSFERGMQYWVQRMQYSHLSINMAFCTYNNISHPAASQPLLPRIRLLRNGVTAGTGGSDSCCVAMAADGSCHLRVFQLPFPLASHETVLN